MSITYPLQNIPDHNFRRWDLKPVNVTSLSVSPFTGQQQVQKYSGEYWTVQVELRPMKRADAEEWLAFLLSLRGPVGTFMMGDPLGKTLRGSGLGTPLTKGGHTSGLEAITTDGWTASETGVLLAGDYIGIGTGGNQKMFKVLQDVDSDGAGEATIDVWPNLRGGLGDNVALQLSNIRSRWRLAQDFNLSANYLQLYGASFVAVEAIYY